MSAAPAHVEEWQGERVRLAEVERALAELRVTAAHETEGSDLRTSVMTHIAWVPLEWREAALETLAGLAERHPSRAILLFPEPEAEDGIDAKASVLAYPLPGARRHVAAEVIELTLRGGRAAAPASIVTPLLVSDLPVFVRWRGRPPFGAPELEQLVDLCDRLVVDSTEWPDVPEAYAELAGLFDRAACSDIAWRRSLPWRRALADLWPGIADARELRVAGPPAEAILLAAWLRSCLGHDVELTHDEGDSLELVVVGGEAVPAPMEEAPTASDLLSAELDELARDRVYEKAVAASA